jgi:PAS domain S-box-containing protein
MSNRLKKLQRLNLLQQELLCDGGLYKDIKRITDAVVEIFNADFCRIWIKRPGDMCEKGCIHAMAKEPDKLCRKREFCLHLISSSGRYTHIDGPHSRMPFSLYKIGRIADGQVSKFLISDVVNDPQIMDHEWGRGLGLVSFAGYKLQDTNSEPIGVLALFSKQSIIPEDDAMLEGIAGITAHVIQTAKVEEKLNMERDKLINIMESMEDGVYIVNQAYDIEYVNPVVEREFGPVKGRKCYEYYHNRDKVCPWCKNQEVFVGMTGRSECYLAKTKRTYDLLGTPLRNYDGTISTLKIFRDITERKQAEEKIRDSYNLLNVINEGIIDAIFLKDVCGRYLLINPSGASIIGKTIEEVIGRDDTALFTPDTARKIMENDRDIINSGEARTYEEYLVSEDGISRTYLTTKGAYRNYEGKVMGIIGIARDVTDRKKAEEDIKNSMSLLHATLESTADGIVAVNKEGKITTFNNRFVDMWRIPESLVTSRDDNQVMAFVVEQLKDAEGFLAKVRELYSQPYAESDDVLEFKDGKVFERYSRPQLIGGESVGRVWSFRDVTERRKIEKDLVSRKILNAELIKVNKMRSQFLANISHELRTPLNAILGFSELLIEKSFGELNEKQTHYVNYINTSGKHLLQLINNILDMSKVEAGRVELEPEEFSLADAMDDVLNIIRPIANKKAVVVESKPIPLSTNVILDRAKFKQIMLNLISNAIKFNKSNGKVDIDWNISEEAKGDIMERTLRISVKDTGIGIKAEDIPRVFRDFEQLDSSVTREYGGTGLGMALTKKLVELHRGKIWVESEYGKWTHFIFVIPQSDSGPG